MFHDGFMGGMWFSWIFWIVILVVIIWLVVQFNNKNRSANSSDMDNKDTPADILKKRYARGEITKEEFDSMKKDLQ